MRLTASKPMNANIRTSPSVEGCAAYVDCDSVAVKLSHDKDHLSLRQSLKKQLEPITRPLVKKLEPITRPLLSPFIVSTSNPYPADTDVPAVRAAKAVARLGRPKKLRLMKNEGLDMYPPSPLVRNPTSLVPEGCYTLVETRKGYFVEQKSRRRSGMKISSLRQRASL
ncbi:hypothetical protein CPB85DRAFT_1432683 [Mucidula mucida]|nr:hypothetical protein CPB85DRAFT_1432683 [Mucidula mucida]